MAIPGSTGRIWWIVLASAIVIVIVLVVCTTFSIFTTSEAVNIFLVAALLLVTTVYAVESQLSRKATEKQAAVAMKTGEEAREAMASSFRPIVVLGRHQGSGHSPYDAMVSIQSIMEQFTYLHNVGPGPALNLRFRMVRPNRMKPSEVTDGQTELRVLGPGEVYKLDLERTFGESVCCSQDLTVEYEDIFGADWRSGLALACDDGTTDRTIRVVAFFYERIC